MPNGHGGSRPGSGQKKKSLTDNILDGNPGKRKLSVVEFPNVAEFQGAEMPQPSAMLSAEQKERIWNTSVRSYRECSPC